MKKLFLLLASTFVLSTSQAAVYGSPVQDNVKQGEQIKVMTLIIKNYNEFKQEWDNTGFDHKPNAKVVNQAKVGDSVNLVIFFSNCLPDQDSNCHLSFQARISKGDKVIYQTPKKQLEAPFSGETTLQLSNLVLDTRFEDHDEGTYRYDIQVTDDNADDTVNLTNYISVTTK